MLIKTDMTRVLFLFSLYAYKDNILHAPCFIDYYLCLRNPGATTSCFHEFPIIPTEGLDYAKCVFRPFTRKIYVVALGTMKYFNIHCMFTVDYIFKLKQSSSTISQTSAKRTTTSYLN